MFIIMSSFINLEYKIIYKLRKCVEFLSSNIESSCQIHKKTNNHLFWLIDLRTWALKVQEATDLNT